MTRRWCRSALATGWLLVSLALSGTAAAATWTVQATPTLGRLHGALEGVSCVSRFRCLAVGETYGTDSTVTQPLAERWDGHIWQVVPVPPKPRHGALHGVSCISGRACVAVGEIDTDSGHTQPLAETWNGIRWAVRRLPQPAWDGSPDEVSLSGVSCSSARACTAVGDAYGATQLPVAERWNGRVWTIQPMRFPTLFNGTFTVDSQGALVAVTCRSATTCTAVGWITPAGQACSIPLVERWSHNQWTTQPTVPVPTCNAANDAGLDGVACPSPTTCTAVGNDDPASVGYDRTLAERWDSGTWSLEPTPALGDFVDPWGGGADLYGVACPSATACIAAGTAGSALTEIPLVETWDGIRWQPRRVALSFYDGELTGISCASRTACIAVGQGDRGAARDLIPLIVRLASR